MSDKLVLIDGHSILNRAFYGVPELTNSKGQPTNAVYGFLSIMFKILDEEKPQYLAVAFDVKAPTFRHKMYAAYKGTRKPMPEELHVQVPMMKEVLRACKICVMEQAGLEADDILGTMAKRAEAQGLDVSLVSGDRDLLQIATEHIKIRIPKTKGGKTEVEDYYAEDVEKAYMVNPLQFIDLKALMGDTADNIPGVPKVGLKTATELMVQYGSLDAIYEHLEEIAKKSIRESLEENRDLADLSKKLATIDVDSDIDYPLSQTQLGEIFTPEAYEMFQQLEFKAFLGRFKSSARKEETKETFTLVTSLKEAKEVFQLALQADRVGLSLFSESNDEAFTMDADAQMSFLPKENKAFLMVGICLNEQAAQAVLVSNEISMEWLKEQLENILSAGRATIAMYDVKKNYDWFAEYIHAHSKEEASSITKRFFDILIAAYLLNPLKNDYDSNDIAGQYLGRNFSGYAQLFGKQSVAKAYEQNAKELIDYVCREAWIAYHAMEVLQQQLQETKMQQLFVDTEMPLSLVLYEMQQAGIRILPKELAAYGQKLAEQIQVLEQEIHKEAGEEFNINSPKQLGEILFDKMQLPGGKKTKTGYSTAADVLEKLAENYPFVNKILEYRGLTKLKSTYADGLRDFIGEDMRIHSTFNQTITATGRISSTEPNLQNIPIRMELGRMIRKVFVPADGYIFMDADYSQIELRILAHMSGDEQLIDAYKMAEDIHSITASKVFHTPLNEVTPLQRRNAKAVNFGIVYGISSFGLSQGLSISTKEAKGYIEEYFETYPGIKLFLDRCVSEAKEKGYSETMFLRRRPIPELKSSNFMQRNFGERVAMNAPIQGTAADIMKIAMILVRDELCKLNMKTRILLQVHDELLLEVAKGEEDAAEKILTQKMENAVELAVHLDIDVHRGDTWYDAK